MAKKNLPYPAEKIGELLIEVDNEVAKKSDLNDFVKKESGRGLSTNDYTTAEKAKLAGIQEGAQKNTVTSVRGALQLNPQVGNVVISAADIGLGNANTRLTALENNKLNKSEKGATNGVASLDENGRVPSSQLPSYVDDVIDDLNFAQFPATGESGKIYIAKDTNKTYRWSGNGYAEVSASLALGETEQTAYSGAKGKKNAEDIAKLAGDLDETHQLASNAESAISEVVELTIPTIESEVANKATKSEAQGYANTAESNANDYTDSEVEKLATVAPIAAGAIVKLTFGWTVSALISFNATTGWGKDLFYYATYGTGTSARTVYNFLHQSGALKTYIDETNTGTILYLHNTTQAGTLSVNNLIPSAVSIEEVSAIPENATLIGDENTLATLSDVRTRLGKTEKAADSAKLGGVDAGNFVQNNGELWNIKAQAAVGADRAKVLTVNGITSEETYGTTAGIIQNSADNPTDFWWNKFRILHNNSAGYFTELAMPFKVSSGLYYRAMANGVQSEWYKIPFASEIPSLALLSKQGSLRYSSGNPLSAGWYRIGKTTRTSQQGWAFRVNLFRHFNANAGEGYTIDCAIGYASGSKSNVYFTQVAGGIYNARFIDKIRVTVSSNAVSYIDMHISANCSNNIEYLFSGNAEALTPEVITDETATTYEFSTVNGLASSYDITAPNFSINNTTNSSGLRVLRPNVTGSTEGGNPLAAAFLVWDTNPYGLIIRCSGSTGAVSLQARREGNETEKYPLLLNPEGGNVGIGTTTPSEKLDVAGNIKASGNVSAINSNFSGTLSVGGNATIDGTMTATATYHSSDERLKTFEGDVEVDLEKLKALPKKYFHWTADADGKRQLGTSAQAVEEIFPELVSTNADGYKSVNYANLSIVALAAVDKLAEQNAELERRLAKIEKLLNIE